MSCPSFDWKGYTLDELREAEQEQHARHLEECHACRQEVEGLRLTLAALARLPEPAPPQRIAFVSDPVFLPSWWQRFWNSAPRLGFAAAALLAIAIVVHAYAPRAASEAVVAQSVERTVVQQLAQEVALLETRTNERVAQLSVALEKRFEAQRAEDLRIVKAAFDYQQKQFNSLYVSAARRGDE